MKINSRKLNWSIFACICLIICFEPVHEFYIENIPPGSPGDCFDIKYPNFKEHYQLRILQNDNVEKRSLVNIQLLTDKNVNWDYVHSYLELRMLNLKKMECL